MFRTIVDQDSVRFGGQLVVKGVEVIGTIRKVVHIF
jgi:hypothetical protein